MWATGKLTASSVRSQTCAPGSRCSWLTAEEVDPEECEEEVGGLGAVGTEGTVGGGGRCGLNCCICEPEWWWCTHYAYGQQLRLV